MWMLLACTRTVAPILEVAPVAATEPETPAERLAWMIDGDPLARRPKVPVGPTDGPVTAFLELDRRPDPKAADWFVLEATHRGTAAVPLARGARLAVLEISLDVPDVALTWLVPLKPVEAREGQTRPALAWLTGPTTGLVDIAERSVLLGWLDAPGIDVTAAARALDSPTYDRLSVHPARDLLFARAKRLAAPEALASGRALLEEATRLALLEVAADRDEEEKAWKETRAAAAASLNNADPIAELLRRANATLQSNAADDTSTGLALVAQAALRLRNACPDAPCGGFDRIDALRSAGRWGGSGEAALWTIIAEKDALDQLRASFDTPFVAAAVDKQVELLLGRGVALDQSILRYPEASAPVRLALSRALSAGDLTTKDDLLQTLKNRLIEQAKTALPQAPERLREPLERIARRGG